MWTVDETLREKIIRKPISQNIGDFFPSERVGKLQKRYLSPGMFERRLNNGETMRREWLAYSPSAGNVYCVPANSSVN